MENFSQANWGFKQLTKTRVTFYHPLLYKYTHQLIPYLSPGFKLKENEDGSITIIVASPFRAKTVIQEMVAFFNKLDTQSFETSHHGYRIPSKVKPVLKGMPLAFEGCVAIILMSDVQNSTWMSDKWQFINSGIGGLFIDPFTLLFYTDYVKVIHPVTSQNYYMRDRIERIAATAVGKIMQWVEEAQPGYEGLAMLSYVEEKTRISRKKIVEIINQKANQVQDPKYFPLLYS